MQSCGRVITIRDEGGGFDPTCVPDPLAAENILRESGRGLSLIKTLMDEMKLERTALGGTELTMIKFSSTPI
jgi:serine/threonine-protein kinase RsbW